MASSNVSRGAIAPQAHYGLLKLLTELDQSQARSYLSSPEGSGSRLPSPFTGLLLQLNYDPDEVLGLVDQIWPARVSAHRVRGRKPLDRLPLVCYILPLCDPDYGTVFNLSEAHRRLKEDKESRSRFGFAGSLPSYSVFRETAVGIAGNWQLFQACQVSPNVLETLLARNRVHPTGDSPFSDALRDLGWRDNLPPGYRDEGKVCGFSRVIGLPRGRACKSHGDPTGAGVEAGPASEGDGLSLSRRSYPRDWRAYNEAQTNEVSEVKALLGGLSDLINLTDASIQGRSPMGRPRFPLGHAVFSVILKAYSGVASRPLESHLKECVDQGYLRNAPGCPAFGGLGAGPLSPSGLVRIPQFNTVCDFLRSDWLTPLLLELVTLTARPLKEVEHEFAVDGTGWATRWYDRWLDHRLAAEADRQQWVKLHLVVGVKSNIIARAAVSPGEHHDNPYFRGLVTETAKHFDVHAVLADLGYSDSANYELGRKLGALVRIPFKSNARPPADDGSEWSRNLRYFLENYERFMAEYHPRSNVESTNSALKRVMPEKIRGRGFGSHTNESLAKLVAYNLRVLAREVRMRDLDLNLPAEALFLEDVIGNVADMRGRQRLERVA